MAQPTTTKATSRLTRNGTTKSKYPFVSASRKPAIAARAMAPTISSRARGLSRCRRTSGLTAVGSGWTAVGDSGDGTGRPSEQEVEERRGTDHAHDQADRDLVGESDQASQDVAGENEGGADDCYPRDTASGVVAHHDADDVRDDQSEEREHAHGDDDGRARHGQ